jgi:hypothetical protein
MLAAIRERRDPHAFGGGRRHEQIEVFAPSSEEALLELLATLRREGRSAAPLGACMSFAGQGFPEQVAISSSRFRQLSVDVPRRRLRVGAGILTGEALAASLVHGLVIPVLPSTSRVTMGGTASADAYSRMTPGLGRESRHIRSIRLVTGRGESLRCSRREHPELFYAAIGGFGLVGIITELEYDLQEIGANPAFCSSTHAFEGVDGLVHLIPEHRPAELPRGAWPGAGSIVMARGARLRTMISRHRFEDTPERSPTVAHQSGPLRFGLELFVRKLPALASWLWQRNWVPGKPVRLLDDLQPAMFFMDANVDATNFVKRIGGDAPVMQQSFIVPTSTRDADAADGAEAFVREAMARFREAGLSPGMFDVGFMPAAEPFLLAGNGHRDAFLVSAAFLVGPRCRAEVVARVFEKLTAVCLNSYDGAIHLTKQAHCSDEVLRDVYAAPIRQLRALRQEHDPGRILQTALGTRLGLDVDAIARAS